MYSNLYDKGLLPRTKNYIEALAKSVSQVWQTLVINHDPKWWGRQAFQSNQIVVKNVSGGVEIFWNPMKDGKNWMSIIEKGRPPYSIKNALLNGSRVRQGSNGRYTIVPFKASKEERGKKDSNVAGEIKKVGEYNDKGTIRNKYQYQKLGGKSNIYRNVQEQKNGLHYSYMKFICVSDKSIGWIYPEIPAGNYFEKLQDRVDKQLQSKKFKEAIAADIADMLNKKKD